VVHHTHMAHTHRMYAHQHKSNAGFVSKHKNDQNKNDERIKNAEELMKIFEVRPVLCIYNTTYEYTTRTQEESPGDDENLKGAGEGAGSEGKEEKRDIIGEEIRDSRVDSDVQQQKGVGSQEVGEKGEAGCVEKKTSISTGKV